MRINHLGLKIASLSCAFLTACAAVTSGNDVSRQEGLATKDWLASDAAHDAMFREWIAHGDKMSATGCEKPDLRMTVTDEENTIVLQVDEFGKVPTVSKSITVYKTGDYVADRLNFYRLGERIHEVCNFKPQEP